MLGGNTLQKGIRIATGHILEYEIGQIVYLVTDKYQEARMVTGISLRPNGRVSYSVSFCTEETQHYGIELSAERDLVKLTSN